MSQFVFVLFLLIVILAVFLGLSLAYMMWMPGSSHSGAYEPPTEQEREIRENLEKHVRTLAGEIGERNFWLYEELEASAAFVGDTLKGFGYRVREQRYRVLEKVMKNIEVEIPGSSAAEEIVIVGAHYDSAIGSPGANDNASAVAALLELARLCADRKCSRTLRFVFFTNEESPFFQTADMGSRVYAQRSRKLNENIVAMLSLETIGYYSNEKGSQKYPFPFNSFYPDTGNFLAFVGNVASRELVRGTIASFRRHASFPSEGAAAPEWIVGIGWSDQWSFWQENYPAIMLTDTAPFRYPAYHTEMDTPEKVDYTALTRVVQGLFGVVLELADK